MSSKLIAAVVVAGGVLATTPFYLSGYFAHKAISDQMNLSVQPFKDIVTITNQSSQLGLYQSHFAYDIEVDLDNPQLSELKKQLKTAKLNAHFEHKMKHGFLSVEADTNFSGQLRTLLDKTLEQAELVLAQPLQPLMSINTTANFSLTGHFQLLFDINVQGFNLNIEDKASGETSHIRVKPTTSQGTITPDLGKFSGSNEQITVKMSDTDINLNQLSFNSQVLHNDRKDSLSLLFADRSGTLNIGSISFSDDSKTIDAANEISVSSHIKTAAGRTSVDVQYAVKKIDIPQVPMSKIDDLLVDVKFSLGEKALLAYSKAAQAFSGNPQEPAQAIALLANLLAEDIDMEIPNIKAKTFAGPIDIVATANVKAMDKATFTANPQHVLAALSYTVSGELPKKLLMMTGQLPPELIDNLVQQQMLELRGEQLVFKLTGDSGNLNLNDKPFM